MTDTQTPGKPRILIVDDERFNVTALHELLKTDYQTMVAINGEQGLRAALSGRPDLILLDVNMPGISGYEVCSRLKSDDLTRSIPVIFITGLSEAEDETRGLEMGAADYITKPFNLAVVRARIRTQMRLKQQNDLLEGLAFIDGLTTIPNRRAFEERSRLEWNRCLRTSRPFSLMMIDVDHFKLYNDSYGHAMGDECLRAVGQAMNGQIQRSGDFVARYGGEEFAAVLPSSDIDTARQIAERLLLSVQGLRREHRASKASAHVTVSIGLASMIPTRAEGFRELVQLADHFLYQAKAEGRNRVCGSRES